MASRKPAGKAKKKSGGLLGALQDKAGAFMRGQNEKRGGGARKRRLDAVIKADSEGKKRPRP